jgi:hypothetical protein
MEKFHEMKAQKNANSCHHVDHVRGLKKRSRGQTHGKEERQFQAETDDKYHRQEKRSLGRHILAHAPNKSYEEWDHYQDTGIHGG